MAQIHLLGGEQDGKTVPNAPMDHPDIFWAVPLLDDPKIKQTRGKLKKAELHQQLAVLAYKFNRVVAKQNIGLEYQYTRCPEMDKVKAPLQQGEK